MKIECIKEKIEKALVFNNRATGKNLNLPVLSCVLLEGKNNQLKIKSTNLELGIEVSIPAKVSVEGIVAVSGSVLANFIAGLGNDKSLQLEVVNGNLKVAGVSNKTLIKSLSHEDFPTIPAITGEKKIKLASGDFARGIKSVWYSAALSSMKPELSSIYICAGDNSLTFTATDSFRLAEKRIKTKENHDFGPILIPFRNAVEIGKIMEDLNEEVEIELNKNQFSFSTDSVYVTSRLVEGSFPDYQQIIPKETKTEAIILKQDLITALKTGSVFSDKFNHVTLVVKPGSKQFLLETKNPDVGENSTALEAALKGEDIEASFNYRYISDCLGVTEADSINLAFSGAGKPLVIRGGGDKSFTYLVMPMNR